MLRFTVAPFIMDRKRLRNDIILVIVLVCAAAAAWAIIRLAQKSGTYAVVSVNGTEIARYPLDKDIETVISSEDGHVNTLVIKDGKASVTEADCPDKLCVRHKEISMAGETIVCLPHKLVISIERGEGG